MSFSEQINHCANYIESFLQQQLSIDSALYEEKRPSQLVEAMRYMSLNGGKRIRPFIILESASLFSVPKESAVYVAGSLELLHCYSLAHDDLPAMDDDDFRRGKPTLHKAYDEATAILTGDALLTMSFYLLSCPENGLSPAVALKLINYLSQASGLGGMIGGQFLDIKLSEYSYSAKDIEIMQLQKTGMLFEYAAASGAIMAGASSCAEDNMRKFGRAIGQAFQIADDLIDIYSTKETAGKETQKDNDSNKTTFINFYGEEKTRKILEEKVEEALDCLSQFGDKAKYLREMTHFIVNRNH